MPPLCENLSARENLKVRTLLLGLHEARNCSSKIQENIFNLRFVKNDFLW